MGGRVAAGAKRVALIGPTLHDVRKVMMAGPSLAWTETASPRMLVRKPKAPMQKEMPNLTSVLIVVSWFGDDLRCGFYQLKPRMEAAAKKTEPRA